MADFGKTTHFAKQSRGAWAAWALASAWLFLAIVGIAIVARADATPNDVSHLDRWPAASSLRLSSTRATLLVFIHPQCPCSSATIAELERLLAHGADRLDIQVVVYLPAGDAEGWRDTALVKKAESIPAVSVSFDVGGREGKLFGATTSGQVLLFEPSGEVVFRGGITTSRGHEGDSDGRDAIEAIAAGRRPRAHETSVFGCAFGSQKQGGGQ